MPQRAGGDGERDARRRRAHERRHAREDRRAGAHQAKEAVRLGGHERAHALRRRRPARLAEGLDDRVVVVEAEIAGVVGLARERDTLRRERLLEGGQVERLVVGDHAVEVEDERARPPRHGRVL